MEKVQVFLSKLSPEGVRQAAIELLEFRSSGILKSTGIVRELELIVAEAVGIGLNNLAIAIDAVSNEIFSRYLEATRELAVEASHSTGTQANQEKTDGHGEVLQVS